TVELDGGELVVEVGEDMHVNLTGWARLVYSGTLGQALENYDAIGEWRARERDSGVTIDSTGNLADGRPVNSPSELREAIAGEPEKFVQTVTQNLLTYALGRRVEYYDMPAVRAVVHEAAESDYSFAAIVKGVALSPPFRLRSAPEVAASETGE
ncbi:MAG TPA: DUF1585 domain-containing protein, partial [Gammaproteobacteria bacterium]|nr:DUF1585 domain-containing protein [Gammaproteobacteria bacterium]